VNEMIERRKMNRGQGGFTLIELLVVVGILAVLGGVAVFAVNGLTDDAEVEACNLEGETLLTAAYAAEATSGLAADVPDFLNGSLKYFAIDGTLGGPTTAPAGCTAVNADFPVLA